MKWIEFIQKAMSNGDSPSTKRLSYVTGVLVASIVSPCHVRYYYWP